MHCALKDKMTNRRKTSNVFMPMLVCCGLAANACDHGVAAREVVIHTDPAGEVLDPGGSCSIVYDAYTAPSGTSSTIGPTYATNLEISKGKITSRYFIAKPGMEDKEVTMHNGERIAEIEADTAFLRSGEFKSAFFETYDGHQFEVYLWGDSDCEGDLPKAPPE